MLNWLCVQNGAREHYAIPRALQRSGQLEALFTEIWAGPAFRRLAVGPLRSIAGRFHEELDAGSWKLGSKNEKAEGEKQKAKVISWNWETVGRELVFKSRKREAGNGNSYAQFIGDGKWFSEKVVDYLAWRGTSMRGKIVFSYDTTALELFTWAKECGAICVLGQMDPGRFEADLVRAEESVWPGWAARDGVVPEAYYQRREAEWRLADRIVVNSRWSLDALVKQGVPAEKLVVIPLCYERLERTEDGSWKTGAGNIKAASYASAAGDRVVWTRDRPLRALFLGQVILRKGIQYLIEAAKLLQDAPVHFDVVGPIGISQVAMNSAPANVTFHGRTERKEARKWFERSQVFVLPTISDGFAITQIEAMAHGLPVIATPNCGEVVTDGEDGFIVRPRDANSLAEAVRRYLKESGLLESHRQACREKARQFTVAKLSEKLMVLEKTYQ